jgi:hypothetical protein
MFQKMKCRHTHPTQQFSESWFLFCVNFLNQSLGTFHLRRKQASDGAEMAIRTLHLCLITANRAEIKDRLYKKNDLCQIWLQLS